MGKKEYSIFCLQSSITLFAIIAVLTSAGGCSGRQQEEAASAPCTVTLSEEQVETLHITTAPLGDYCFSGTIKAGGRLAVSPRSMAAITSKVSGNIERIIVDEGGHVASGQIVAWLSSTGLTELQSRYASALSRRDYLAGEYERQRQMLAEQVGAGKDYDRAQTDYQSACREVSMLEGQLRQIGADTSRSPSPAGKIAVRSTITGTVEHIGVQTGQYITPDVPMMRIVNTEGMYADLLVFQHDVGKVREGQQVRLISGENQEYSGKVSTIANTMQSDVQAVHVRVSIDEGFRQNLIVGMYVEGQISTDSICMPAVSEDAIIEDDGKTYIFTAAHEGSRWVFTPVEVRRGLEEADMVAITPADSAVSLASIALHGAYYIYSEMKKGETGEE